MNAAVVDTQPRPGSSPFGRANADWFTAGQLARLGAGAEAEPLARQAVEEDTRKAVDAVLGALPGAGTAQKRPSTG